MKQSLGRNGESGGVRTSTVFPLHRFRASPETRNFRGGRCGPPGGEILRGGFAAGGAWRGGRGYRNEFWRAWLPVRPVALQDEFVDAGAGGRKINLGDGHGSVPESVTYDEEIVTACFVESDRPALPQTVRREALRVGADPAEGTLDDFFRGRAADGEGVAVWFAVRTREEGSVRCQIGTPGLLYEIAFEGTAEFRTDGHAAGCAAAAFEEAGWESDPRANLAVEEDMAHR